MSAPIPGEFCSCGHDREEHNDLSGEMRSAGSACLQCEAPACPSYEPSLTVARARELFIAAPELGETSGRYWTLPLSGTSSVQVYEVEDRSVLYVSDEFGNDGWVCLTEDERRAVAAALLRAESHTGDSPSSSHAPPPVDVPASLSGPGIGTVEAAVAVAVAEDAYDAAEGGHVRAKRWRELTDARHALAAAVRDADVATRRWLWAAFVAGFAASSTGFNGEWPYEDRPGAMAADLAPVFDRWATGGDRS